MPELMAVYDGSSVLAMTLGIAIGYVTGRIHAQTRQALAAAEEAKAIALALLLENEDGTDAQPTGT